ncbi:hypothetical protein F4805DRAFT_414790 [Annulohypoxylon moriforme]|nr:hypothetical protein F4805DRAFT_414790 [Annulohypoxylon moriforme]
MERMPLALTGQGEAVKEHIFNRIPVELMIKIYKSLFDLKDVKATLSTCRRAKAIFYENAGDIAKAYLFRTLDPSNLKLLVMAVASRDVDPQDPASIEQFFRKYIWRSGPWPSSYITMDMVASLEPFCETCNHAWMWVSLPFEYKRTPTQEARKLRGGLMIETATNLFYRGPGKDGAIFWRSPNVEWADKYWEAFSRIEVMMVLEVSFYLQKIILHGKRLCITQ